MLALEAVEPAPLVGARQLRRGFLRQVEVGAAAPLLDVVALAAGRQHLGGVLADRVEHHVALLVRALFDAEQALVDERRDTVEDVDADLARRAADAVGHIQLAAADEHGQAVEQPAGAGFEQVVAPRDRPAQRLLALRQVPRARREQREVVLEPGDDLFGRQELDPRRGELDGQRHPVQPRGDPADRRRVGVRQLEGGSHRAGTGHEQLGGFEPLERCRRHACAIRPGRFSRSSSGQPRRVRWRRQPGHGELLLAVDAQRGPAGDEDPQARRAGEHLGQHRGRVDHLLEVVEDEQHPAFAQRLGDAVDHGPVRLVGHADRARDGRRDQLPFPDRLQRDEPDPVGEVVGGGGRDLQRQTRLADATRPGERQQPRPAQQPERLLELVASSDEGRQLGRQIVRPGVDRMERREFRRQIDGHHLGEPLGGEQVLEAVLAEIAQLEGAIGTGRRPVLAPCPRSRSGRHWPRPRCAPRD